MYLAGTAMQAFVIFIQFCHFLIKVSPNTSLIDVTQNKLHKANQGYNQSWKCFILICAILSIFVRTISFILRCCISPFAPFKVIQDSPWIVDSKYGILDSLSVELGIRIAIVVGLPNS